ncbi:IS66 family insertion sequence element accessory protein TnpA [Myroides sp. C15-4]|uniref:IS66 family insertion sequence element accessory protein TnpA n=1 Tax=Myroides sp. C15-4 TaxID=3400532 RepID=UPI003D2F8370
MNKQEIMYSHVEEWKASRLTQAAYCEEQRLKLPTFSYWVQKYHKQSSLDRADLQSVR